MTWPGSCSSFQCLFVAAMLGAIAFAAFLGFLFLNLVPYPGSWTLEEVVSFQEGKAKGIRQGSGEHFTGWMISYLFTLQVGRWAAAFLAALVSFPWQVMADATAAAYPFSRVGICTLVGMLTGFLTLGDDFAFVGLLAHATMIGLTQAYEEMLQQAAAAFSAFEDACTLVGVPAEFCGFGTATLSPRRRCHKALTSEAQTSPRVDVGDTPDSEIEHEGKSVKEPCSPEVFPVFVRSPSTSLVALLSPCWCRKSRRALGFLCTCSDSLWTGRWWLVNSL